jgi:hypothetical protein
VAPACNPSYSGSRDQEGHSSKPAQADSSWDLSQKYPTQKNKNKNRAGEVAQVAVCLPSKHEALSSNHQKSKKKKNSNINKLF